MMMILCDVKGPLSCPRKPGQQSELAACVYTYRIIGMSIFSNILVPSSSSHNKTGSRKICTKSRDHHLVVTSGSD